MYVYLLCTTFVHSKRILINDNNIRSYMKKSIQQKCVVCTQPGFVPATINDSFRVSMCHSIVRAERVILLATGMPVFAQRFGLWSILCSCLCSILLDSCPEFRKGVWKGCNTPKANFSEINTDAVVRRNQPDRNHEGISSNCCTTTALSRSRVPICNGETSIPKRCT